MGIVCGGCIVIGDVLGKDEGAGFK